MSDRSPDSLPREAELREGALRAMRAAYAPYSRFQVGAALLCGDDIILGCNVENASYPACSCAERTAVTTAVVRGHRTFDALVLATGAEMPTPPCGICRQILGEFAPGLPILSITTGGAEGRWTLAELLPHPFNPASLDAPSPTTDPARRGAP